MNSIKPERRFLYLHIEPEDWQSVLMLLTGMWSMPMAGAEHTWWERYSCKDCKQRYEYELSKWKKGEYAWRRGMCLRHYFIRHLADIAPQEPEHLLDNRPVYIEMTPEKIVFEIATNNYQYHIDLDRDKAVVNITYKGKEYIFSYRNHTNAYPLLSSYAYILKSIMETIHVFRLFLANADKYRSYANVVINDTTLSPTIV
jgi:hypothetical protein